MPKSKMCSFIQDMELEEDDYDIESMLIFDPDDQVKDKECHKHLRSPGVYSVKILQGTD